MSDYLGHLVERSFAPTPEVRPQVPSLFEPKPAHEQSGLRLNSREETPAQAPEKPVPGPTLSYTNEPITAKARERAGYSGRNEIAPVKNEAKSTDESFHSNSRIDEFIAPPKRSEADPLIASIVRPVLRSEKPPSSAILDPTPLSPPKEVPKSSPVGVRPVKSINTPVTEKPRTPSAAPSTTDLPIDEDPRRHGNRHPSSVDADRSLTPREAPKTAGNFNASRLAKTSAIQPLAVVSSPAKKAGREESPIPIPVSMPPSIQVTIGRVEIRATPPPVIARNAPRKESGMSLENYLQRRAGGGPS